LRFLFNNKNGLVLTHTELINFITITKELQADWVGIVGTHMASDKLHVRDCVLSSFQSRQGFNNLNAVFSSSNMDYNIDRKFGGVLQFAVNSLAPIPSLNTPTSTDGSLVKHTREKTENC
jgi:hypothetical protein